MDPNFNHQPNEIPTSANHDPRPDPLLSAAENDQNTICKAGGVDEAPGGDAGIHISLSIFADEERLNMELEFQSNLMDFLQRKDDQKYVPQSAPALPNRGYHIIHGATQYKIDGKGPKF